MDFILQIVYWVWGMLFAILFLGALAARLCIPTTDEEWQKHVLDCHLNAKDYCVLKAADSKFLEKLVNAAITHGYRPVGSVSYGKGDLVEYWVQAVEKVG